MSEFVITRKTLDLGQPSQNAGILVEKKCYRKIVQLSDDYMAVTRLNFDIRLPCVMDAADGNPPTVENVSFPSGKYYALSGVPQREGMLFVGWFDHPLAPTSALPSLSGLMTADDAVDIDKLSVYAHWQLPAEITFDAHTNGGEMPGSWQEPGYYVGQPFGSLPKPPHPTLHFTGWYTDPQEGDRVSKSDIVSGACTLYARYAATVYEIEDVGEQWEQYPSLNPDASQISECYRSFGNFGLSGPSTASMTLRVAGYPQFTFYIRCWGGQYDYVDCSADAGCSALPPAYEKTQDEEYYLQKKAEYEALGYAVQLNTIAGVVYWTAEDLNGVQVEAGSFQAPPTAGSTIWYGNGSQALSGYMPVTYAFDDPSENLITIRYVKSGNPANDDRGYVLIPKRQQSTIPYLTFEALEDGSSLRLPYFLSGEELLDGEPDLSIALETSKNGDSWQDWDRSTVQLDTGDKLRVRAKNSNKSTCKNSDISGNGYTFVMEGRIAASGSLMSLFDVNAELSSIYTQHAYLFQNCSSLVTAPELPAVHVGSKSYRYMFQNCVNLLSAPQIGLTGTVDSYTCHGMFENCSSLTSAGDLKGTTINYYAYNSMFRQCTSLVNPPRTSCRTFLNSACLNMFNGCSSLSSTPSMIIENASENAFCRMFKDCTSLETSKLEIRAISAQRYAFEELFANCSSLTSAPDFGEISCLGAGNGGEFLCAFYNCKSLTAAPHIVPVTLGNNTMKYAFRGCTNIATCSAVSLPATSLSAGCYYGMFEKCGKLQDAPALPATKLQSECYRAMFCDCSSLTSAPYLPAAQLSANSYRYMFNGCKSLSSISVELTSWNPSGATASWVENVAANGVFTCPAGLTQTTGVNNIPKNWAISTT